MSKQRKRRKSLNTDSPSTPKHATKHHVDGNMFSTPKSHLIQDDDSDSSPYSLSFSQRAIGVEVTWGEKSRSIPFKTRKTYERRDTESPPTKTYVDVEPVVTESPKGLYKFLSGWERRRVATQFEDDIERINNDTTSAPNSNNTNTTINTGSNFDRATEQVEETKSIISNSPNFKQLLNDSEDFDLILCSQRIEEEVCSRTEPVIGAIASKGFSELFSDDDDDMLLANLDDPLLLDKKLPHKSSFARHKSIAIQPNSSIINGAAPSNINSDGNSKNSATKSGVTPQPVKLQSTEPSTPSTTRTTTTTPVLVRHKSMPSPNVTISNSTKKCSAEEIAIKRQNAKVKLEQLKQRQRQKKS